MSFLPPALVPNISGHVHRVKRKKGYVWYVKYRAPDPTAPCGRRQVEKALGPEWPHEGPPPPKPPARVSAGPRRSPGNTGLATTTGVRQGRLDQGRAGESGADGARGRRGTRARGTGSTDQRCAGASSRRASAPSCELLRFHDLRHTFGSNAINRANLVQVQAWMGHADHRTTMRYLHHKSLDAEADLLAGAFAVNNASEAEQLLLSATQDEQ